MQIQCNQNKEGNVDILSKILQGLSFVPNVVNGIEGLLGNRPGAEKRNAALSFLEATLSMSEALVNRQITMKLNSVRDWGNWWTAPWNA
jgi:hypothetical protein